MATKFLTTKPCASEIEEIVEQAKEFVWLVSPYIDIDRGLKERLQDQDRAGIPMRLVYGKRKLREAESEWLNSLNSLRIYYRDSLHAKCYMNEDFALITSLNLYEYSQVNNDEFGILISRQDDEDLYQSVRDGAEYIFRHADIKKERDDKSGVDEAAVDDRAEAVKLVQEIAEAKREMQEEERRENDATRKRSRKRTAKRERADRGKPALPQAGVCIRDGAEIGFDILKPYCDNCFRSWNRYKNRGYEENLCHACGRRWPTDMDRPLCWGCRRTRGGALIAQGHGRRQPEYAVCIRDGEAIEFNLSKPYCNKCYRSWNRYKNREYVEVMCHICESVGPATMDSPICAFCCLNVQYIAFTQTLGDGYVPWVSVEWGDADDLPW